MIGVAALLLLSLLTNILLFALLRKEQSKPPVEVKEIETVYVPIYQDKPSAPPLSRPTGFSL